MSARRIEHLSLDAARRVALAAQGFADPRPSGRIDRRHVRRVLDRIGVVQVDSVNVLVRSEELPLFARLGPHPRELLRTMEREGEAFEYWAHEASVLPMAHEPLFRWKKARALAGGDPTVWGGIRDLHVQRPSLVEGVLEEIAARGPIAPSRLTGQRGPKRSNGWGWKWDQAKVAVENLFWTGRIVAAGRSSSFEREYDLPERVIPASVRAVPDPDPVEARKQLLLVAARSLGVSTVAHLADYHRQRVPEVRPLVEELVEEGALLPVAVEGWTERALVPADVRVPRQVAARALLSPFDSLVWERTRTERLFGFRYRIEIYVPAAKRRHGYYVLPFLLGDELVARVDLKADRADATLRVQSAWAEPGVHERVVAGELRDELRSMAQWLGLDRVHATGAGDLGPALVRALGRNGTAPA